MALTEEQTGERIAGRAVGRHDGTVLLLWSLLILYAAARFLQILPGRVSMQTVVALHVLPPAVFALLHGAKLYRMRHILTFVALCLVVGNIFENLSILSGFPFGHLYYTDVMGPKLFAVPILLGLAYVGMAYFSWIIANLIVGNPQGRLAGPSVVTLPLAASFVMVAWDVSQEPAWSTIVRAWVWPNGGAYFGAPLSNFLGWFFTVYVIYQLFALYLWRRSVIPNPLPPGQWELVVLFYAVSAAGNLLLAAPQPGLSVVRDPSGAEWSVSAITTSCAVASLFTMGAFAFLAWVKLRDNLRGGATLT